MPFPWTWTSDPPSPAYLAAVGGDPTPGDAPPSIVNSYPEDGEYDVDPRVLLKFGVRDPDTRVLRSSIRSILLFHRVHYIADNLPQYDPALRRGEGKWAYTVFSDAAVAGPATSPAAQSLVPAGLEIVKTSALRQDSFLFASDRLVPDRPCGAEIVLTDLANWITGTQDYYSDPDYTGIMVSMINWKYRTGLFAMLMYDGVDYYINLTGPATGVGTRYVIQNSLLLDWSTGTWRFRFVWDDTPTQESVFFIVDNGTEEFTYVLDQAAVAALKAQTFLPGLTIGAHSSSVADDRVMAGVGLDNGLASTLTVQQLSVSGYGERLLAGGHTSPAVASVEVTPNSCINLRAGERDWLQDGPGTVTEVSGNLSLTVEPNAGAAYLKRAEPDLSRQQWMVLATFQIPYSAPFPASVKQGLGVEVSDGNSQFVFSFLDDSLAKRVGFWTGGTGETLSDFSYGVETDWTVPSSFLLAGDGVLDRMLVEVNEDLYLDLTYSGSDLAASTELGLKVGLLASSSDLRVLEIGSLWVFPTALFAEPLLTTLPDSQGWVLEQSGAAAATIVDDEYYFNCGDYPGEYVFYTDVPPGAETELHQGGALYFKFLLVSWADANYASSPYSSEIGPIVAVAISDNFSADLCLVRTMDADYVYIRNEDGGLSDVLAQGEIGKLISAKIDLGVKHSFLLDVKPGRYVRLFVDLDSDPAIDIPWDQFSLRPSILPAGAVCGFGSINPDAAVSGTFSFCRAGRGRGYDLRASVTSSDDVLIAWAYDSHATLLTDLEDS